MKDNQDPHNKILMPPNIENADRKKSHTVLISGLAVTICFSAGKNLFCLNSMSPTPKCKATIKMRSKQEGNRKFTTKQV